MENLDNLIFEMNEKYQEYLIDEAKFTGSAESISFPKKEQEIVDIIKYMKQREIPITIQGGKTGIVGGAISESGHIMNLSYFNQVIDFKLVDDENATITVQSGINIMDLKKEISKIFKNKNLFFPVEPTETSATIGGIIATNAQGINGFYYGDVSNYIENIKVIFSDGEAKVVEKIDEIKEIVIGKEGITALITEVTLKLIKKHNEIWGISFFFEKEEDAFDFCNTIQQDLPKSEFADIIALEYMDKKSIELVEKNKANIAKIKDLPDIDENFYSICYFEIAGEEDSIEEIAAQLMEIATDFNSNPDIAWAVSGYNEIEKMRAFRHCIPETANLLIEQSRHTDKRITKLSTDMRLENVDFNYLVTCYKDKLKEETIDYCMFGHVLENHLHINILPNHYEEYLKGVEIIKTLALDIKNKNGKLVCENGIGKLKKGILKNIIPQQYLEDVKNIKQKYDDKNIFNRGNVI